MPAITEKAEKQRLIVLPLQPQKGQDDSGIGLAVHFLLANIMGVHTGFKESWLGSRVKKMFGQKEAFKAYLRGSGTRPDLLGLGREMAIRYWIEGSFLQDDASINVHLQLRDTQQGNNRQETDLVAHTEDHLTGFREDFLQWMDTCGFPFPQNRLKRALWPEKTSAEALDLFGRALEQFYLHPSWGEKGPLDAEPFEQAVKAAPASYLANDLEGWIHYKNQDYPAAEASFKAALKCNPDGLAVMAGLMWCAIFTGEKEEAYRWAEARYRLREKSRQAAISFVDTKMK